MTPFDTRVTGTFAISVLSPITDPEIEYELPPPVPTVFLLPPPVRPLVKVLSPPFTSPSRVLSELRELSVLSPPFTSPSRVVSVVSPPVVVLSSSPTEYVHRIGSASTLILFTQVTRNVPRLSLKTKGADIRPQFVHIIAAYSVLNAAIFVGVLKSGILSKYSDARELWRTH